MTIHEAAETFPMFDKQRMDELIEDIRVKGQQVPIVLYRGAVLDGRNRLAACKALGIEPKTKEITGDIDPWSHVWSLNGSRRDLVDEQRYLIWKHCHEQSVEFQAERQRIADEANAKRSAKAKEQHAVSNPRAGETMVGEQSVPVPETKHPERKTKAATSKTNPGAVQRGDKLAKERPDLAAKVRQGEIKPAEAHRQMKKQEVAEKAAALPSGTYRVLYADPPWHYGDGRTGDRMTATGAQHHYPTMKLSDLKALDVESIAADDAVLFLWATAPLLEDALELAPAWGFKYKTQFIWDKVKHNLGHYNSVRHEVLLICTRGSATPDNVKLYDSVQVIEKTKIHSQKPEEFREIIDTLYLHGPRIELFRRGDAPKGWRVWGNEANA
jgi:N6-adenosine-specific RNA methylase IME4